MGPGRLSVFLAGCGLSVRAPWVVPIVIALAAGARAQNPDVRPKVDFYPTYRNTLRTGSTFRWYDGMGRHSTLGLTLALENGFYAFVSERLQKIDNDPDRSQLDEAYVEDPGFWRVGRQYLPFGQRNLLREAVAAARLDTDLFNKHLPSKIAVFDEGKDRPRGAMVHVGGRYGLSVAVGDRIANSATCLTSIREPESPLPSTRGYRLAIGADASIPFYQALVEAEYLGLRRPNAPGDSSEDYTDIRLGGTVPDTQIKLTAGWAHSFRRKTDTFRLEGEARITKNVALRTFFRFRNGTFNDLGIGLRVRL